nr:MAG TPA_asm: hypothetical protein [Caudoviricetes sp.]DAQ21776.1 MAG TPA: hypothetical protein [Caudoviricetes sp.]
MGYPERRHRCCHRLDSQSKSEGGRAGEAHTRHLQGDVWRREQGTLS